VRSSVAQTFAILAQHRNTGLIVQESVLSRKKKKTYRSSGDDRFPWLELAIDFNANGNRASLANDRMRLCELCSATMEMQRVSAHKEFYEACFHGKHWEMSLMQK
jgi:hypothetical protein